MIHNSKTSFTGRAATAVVAVFILASLTLSSCTKKSESGNDAAKFVGTWNGTSTCGGSVSFTMNAGSNGSSLTTSGTVGSPGCVKSVTMNITASGNTISIPAQTFTDDCGLTYTISGSGSLSGSTLTTTQTVSGAVSATCTFTGTK